MNKVWLTGDAVVDLIPDGDTRYLKCPGGAPANVAVGIARLAGECGFFGRVGADPLGRFMKKVLSDENVDTSHLILDDQQRTSTVLVDLDAQGERSFTFMVKPSADQFMEIGDIPRFQQGQWLHFCSIALANEPSRSSVFDAMASIKASGGFVSFDPNLRDEVWQQPSDMRAVVMKAVMAADVVKFSEEELLFLTETTDLQRGLAALESYHIPLVLVTLGAEGALVKFNGNQYQVASQAVTPVDTTGAGDAFVCGVLAKLAQHNVWLNEVIILEAVKWGNYCGALATTQKGAMTALPTSTQLQHSLRN